MNAIEFFIVGLMFGIKGDIDMVRRKSPLFNTIFEFSCYAYALYKTFGEGK